MVKDLKFPTYCFKSLDSTQKYLLDKVKKSEIDTPALVLALSQTNGKGSRNNTWESGEGNLYFSFAIDLKDLSEDLALESSSIYFSYILKELIAKEGSSLWMKWPNDFYINDKKIGGTITNVYKDILICGIGINTKSAPKGFATLDIDIDQRTLLENFKIELLKKHSWKLVFSKFKVEFELSKKFSTHYKNEKISLNKAILQDDGSLICDGKRIYSLR